VRHNDLCQVSVGCICHFFPSLFVLFIFCASICVTGSFIGLCLCCCVLRSLRCVLRCVLRCALRCVRRCVLRCVFCDRLHGRYDMYSATLSALPQPLTALELVTAMPEVAAALLPAFGLSVTAQGRVVAVAGVHTPWAPSNADERALVSGSAVAIACVVRCACRCCV
jgi:hypothetical protein